MQVKINFHSSLLKYTKVSSCNIEADTFTSLSRALQSSFPYLKQKFIFNNIVNRDLVTEGLSLISNEKILTEKDFCKNQIFTKEITIVPCLIGGGSGGKAILVGAAIAAFAYFALPGLLGVSGGFGALMEGAGWQAAVGQAIMGVGINLALSGVLQLISPLPEKQASPESATRLGNDAFGGITNTTDSNQVVALHYGLVRVGGQLVSGYIKTINHQQNDNIKVSDYVSSS